MRLLDHANDVFSQAGEDGILAKVLEMLPARDKWCVEFGAWDGQLFSNTCHLIDKHDYSAVMIEGDSIRFQDLIKRHGANAKVVKLNKWVGFDSKTGLDTLLAGTPIPRDFDLLSIDIDGNDYHVWNALTAYQPKAVIIEFNATMPTDIEFIQPADRKVTQGASLLALTNLGKKKGYELVCVTQLNSIFVRADFFPLFGIADNSPKALREDLSHITYLFAGYDGSIFVSGHDHIPWSGIKYVSRIEQLPKAFRRFPTDFGPVRRKLFKIYKELLRWKSRSRQSQYIASKSS